MPVVCWHGSNLVETEFSLIWLGLEGAWQDERARVGYAFPNARIIPP
jgi:hypothetical protein